MQGEGKAGSDGEKLCREKERQAQWSEEAAPNPRYSCGTTSTRPCFTRGVLHCTGYVALNCPSGHSPHVVAESHKLPHLSPRRWVPRRWCPLR